MHTKIKAKKKKKKTKHRKNDKKQKQNTQIRLFALMFFLPFFSHSGLLLKIVCLHFSLYPSIFFLLPRVFFFFASRRCASVYVCVCLCVCKTAKRARSFVKYGAGRLSVTSQDEMPASALPNFPIKANEDGPTAKL